MCDKNSSNLIKWRWKFCYKSLFLASFSAAWTLDWIRTEQNRWALLHIYDTYYIHSYSMSIVLLHTSTDLHWYFLEHWFVINELKRRTKNVFCETRMRAQQHYSNEPNRKLDSDRRRKQVQCVIRANPYHILIAYPILVTYAKKFFLFGKRLRKKQKEMALIYKQFFRSFFVI